MSEENTQENPEAPAASQSQGECKGKNKKLLMMGIGGVLIVLALTADLIGLGSSSNFGFKQILLLVIGLVVVFLGFKSEK